MKRLYVNSIDPEFMEEYICSAKLRASRLSRIKFSI